MSPSLQQNADKKNRCPDSELLTAFSENRVDGFVLGAVAAHLIQCVECAELHHRLLNLANADLQTDHPEWANAEKRLDNWMNAYLRDHPGQAESQPQTQAATSTTDAGSAWNFRSWRIRWALGAVAALILVATTSFFWSRSSPSHSSPPEVATQTAPPSPVSPSPASPQEEAKPAPENSSKIETASSEEEPQPKARDSATKPKSHAPPTRVASSDQNAALHKETPEPSRSAPNSEVPLETPAPESTATAAVLAEPSDSAAAVPAAGSNSSPDAILASKTSMAASKGFVPVVKSTAPSTAVPTAALPILVSLGYSTSMWIQLSSGTPPAEGTFPFHGTLLKPVDLPVGVPFDTETRVDGLGAVNDGRISLSIRGFFFRGTRYKLKTGSGAARVEPFNGGKTLEIWIDEDSAYERVPRGATASR